ncbi:MAG: hypothetical protein HKM04_05170 [Legionellales bacterium]|nr:hypothetical protein [Legionellales bacterium]
MENFSYYDSGAHAPLSEKTLAKFCQGWHPPTLQEITQFLVKLHLTSYEAGMLVGVSQDVFSDYLSGERQIAYAEWRLLLIYAGVVKPDLFRDRHFIESA